MSRFPSGIQGEEIGDVKFNKDGDRIGRYSIFQFQKKKGQRSMKFTYVRLGEFGEYVNLLYNESGNGRARVIVSLIKGNCHSQLFSGIYGRELIQELAMDSDRLVWPKQDGKSLPKSVCSQPCAKGHIRSLLVRPKPVYLPQNFRNWFIP